MQIQKKDFWAAVQQARCFISVCVTPIALSTTCTTVAWSMRLRRLPHYTTCRYHIRSDSSQVMCINTEHLNQARWEWLDLLDRDTALEFAVALTGLSGCIKQHCDTRSYEAIFRTEPVFVASPVLKNHCFSFSFDPRKARARLENKAMTSS